MIYSLATLGRVPAYLSDDDGAYASAAYQFWETGRPGVPGYKDVIGLNRDVWAFGRIAAAVQGVFLKHFGVSIFAGQLPSFLAGLGLLAVTIALGYKLWGIQTGLLAGLLLACSGQFFSACRWTRPDILLAFLFILSLWLVASAEPTRPYPRMLAAGLIMGFAGDVHMNGFLLAPVPLLFWFLLRPQPAQVRLRASFFYCGGALLGVIYWYLTHIWLHPKEVLHQMAVYGGSTHGLRVLSLGFWGSIGAEIQRYTRWFWSALGHRHLLEGICVIAGGLWMLLKETKIGLSLVVTWLAVFLIAAFFMANPFGWYLIYVWPIFVLWMARFFKNSNLRPWTQILMALLIGAYLLNLGLWDFKARKETPLQSKLHDLRRSIPAEAPVLGNGAFWFAFWDRDFTDEMYMVFRKLEKERFHLSQTTGWQEEQKRRGWRYIVASDDLRLILDPQIPLSQFLENPAYSKRIAAIRAARAFSLEHCEVERRLGGVSDEILILRVMENNKNVAR
jgi:4-amino-4-deoxy-L-arabinose transferase-like glycosyltransferase